MNSLTTSYNFQRAAIIQGQAYKIMIYLGLVLRSLYPEDHVKSIFWIDR